MNEKILLHAEALRAPLFALEGRSFGQFDESLPALGALVDLLLVLRLEFVIAHDTTIMTHHEHLR